jgi:ABC-2 type transport system ATP-binding protein
MDSGRMLIEEPMSDLAARLREVRVTLEGPAAVPEHPPAHWLQVRAVGTVVSYIDTRYSEDGLQERIRGYLGAVKSVDVQPMSLRAVFTALARAARAGNMS